MQNTKIFVGSIGVLLLLTVGCGGGKKDEASSPPPPTLPVVTVSSLAPASGSIVGGTAVRIGGSGFTGGTFSVTLNGITCASPTVVSDTALDCTAGASDSPRAGDLVVTRQDDAQVVTVASAWEYLQPQTPFTWVGTGGNHNWSNSANWAGGSVPGSGDDVIFSGDWCSGSACNVKLDDLVNVKSLKMRANFPGTITEDEDEDVEIGSSSTDEAFWIEGGTWEGANMAMGWRTVRGIARFSGGTMNFREAFSFYGSLYVTGGAFSTSMVLLYGTGTQHLKASVPLPQLEILNDSGGHVEVEGTVQTTDLNINSSGTCTGNAHKVLGGTIQVSGDMFFQAACGGTTSFVLSKTNPGLSFTGGIFPGSLSFAPSSASSVTLSNGSTVRIDGGLSLNSNASVNLAGSGLELGGSLSVAGQLDAHNSNPSGGGAITVGGNLSVPAGGSVNLRGGSMTVSGSSSVAGTVTP